MKQVDLLLKTADNYYQDCLLKVSKIISLPNGKFRVVSQKGRNLGTYHSEKSAKKRLKQVEFFKHLDSLEANDSKPKLDLSGLDEFSLSAMLRELNKNKDKKPFKLFLKVFKINFDKSIKEKVKHPEKIALDTALMQLNKHYHIKLDKIKKTASVAGLGDPVAVARYLSDIIKFMISKISTAKRQGVLNKLKRKFYYLNEHEISSKKMPASASIGQSITFVKTVLFQQQAAYVRQVLNNLVRYL